MPIYQTRHDFYRDLYKDPQDDFNRRREAKIKGAFPGAIVGGLALGLPTALLTSNPLVRVGAGALGMLSGAAVGDYIISRKLLRQQAEEAERKGNIAKAMYLRSNLVNKGSIAGVLANSILSPHEVGTKLEKDLLAYDLYRQYKSERT